MDPGTDTPPGALTCPARARAVSGTVLLASSGIVLVACSVASPQTTTPDAPVTSVRAPSAAAERVPDAGEPPSAPGEEFTMGGRREDAIAVVEASEHHVEASTLALAQAGVSYVVHAVCTGEGWMRYRLTVDDLEVSASRMRCGRDVVDTAFTAEGGERVQLHLDAPAEEGEGSLAEVVPAP